MRRQIERISLVMSLVVVLSTTLISLFLGVSTVRGLQEHQVQWEAGLIAGHVAGRVGAGDPVDADYLSQFVLHGSSVRVKSPTIDVALRMVGQQDAMKASTRLGDLTVIVGHDDTGLRDEIAAVLRAASVVSLLVVLLAWFLGRMWARRLQVIFDDFVQTADRLSSGDIRLTGRRFGLAELDQVAQALEDSAMRIQDLLVVERRLVSEASHQLRTPITALSLQLEEIQETADDPEAVRAGAADALRQVARMTEAIEELIAVRRGQESPAHSEAIGQLLEPVLSEARTTLGSLGRELITHLPSEPSVGVNAGALRHVVSILLDNATEHGRGTVRLDAEVSGDWLQLAVRDEGKGLSEEAAEVLRRGDRGVAAPTESVSRSIGLPLALALTAAQGGRLEWRAAEPAVVRLYLPLNG